MRTFQYPAFAGVYDCFFNSTQFCPCVIVSMHICFIVVNNQIETIFSSILQDPIVMHCNTGNSILWNRPKWAKNVVLACKVLFSLLPQTVFCELQALSYLIIQLCHPHFIHSYPIKICWIMPGFIDALYTSACSQRKRSKRIF